MAFVKLAIVAPENNYVFRWHEENSLRMVGAVVDMPAEAEKSALYYRWYSSLHEPPFDAHGKPLYLSINGNVQTRAAHPFEWKPDIGSHAITLAVTDRRSDQGMEELKATTHGGVTGGAEDGEGQCLVHVFLAEPLPPQGDLGALRPQDLRLIARAPRAWGKTVETPSPPGVRYEVNQSYIAYNRLRYRWQLIRDGASVPDFQLAPLPTRMDCGFYSEFNDAIKKGTDTDPNPDDVFVVHYQPAREDLPELCNLRGSYNLVLHVEDASGQPPIGHDTKSLRIQFVS